MLTTKARVLLAASLALSLLALWTQAYAGAIAAVATWLLFALNAWMVPVPRLEAGLEVDRDLVEEEQALEVDLAVAPPRGRLLVSYRVDRPRTFRAEGGADQGRVLLDSAEETAVTCTLRPHRFGTHRVGPLSLRTEDPSGFRILEHTVGQGSTVLVHPRVEELDRLPVRLQERVGFMGATDASDPGDGFEFYTLRDYQSGDSIRSINWRATARSDGLMVNQRARETYLKVAVLLDAREGEDQGRLVGSPFAKGARALAAVVDHLIGRRDQLDFYRITDELDRIGAQTPERQRRTILDTMTGTETHGHLPWREVRSRLMPQLGAQVPVVIASSCETDPGIIPFVRELVSREHSVVVLSAPTSWSEDLADDPRVEARAQTRDLVASAIRGSGATFVDLAEDRPLTMAVQEAAEL